MKFSWKQNKFFDRTSKIYFYLYNGDNKKASRLFKTHLKQFLEFINLNYINFDITFLGNEYKLGIPITLADKNMEDDLRNTLCDELEKVFNNRIAKGYWYEIGDADIEDTPSMSCQDWPLEVMKNVVMCCVPEKNFQSKIKPKEYIVTKEQAKQERLAGRGSKPLDERSFYVRSQLSNIQYDKVFSDMWSILPESSRREIEKQIGSDLKG